MWRLPVVLLAAVIGCGSPRDGSSNPDVDAGTDAKVFLDAFVPPASSRVPFTTTGTTPAGSLDDVQFIAIDFVDGGCPGTYHLLLYRTDHPSEVPVVRFDVTLPASATPPLTGTIMARAFAGTASTDQVRFEIVQLDIPPADETQPVTLRIAGRMALDLPPWSIDFTVDMLTSRYICLIL
jgi:hypothetical protein